MYQYDSPSHAIEELHKRGYTEDFNLKDNCIVCKDHKFTADEFEVREVYRFEGDSDPGDEAIVFGIESSNGTRGILVNGYGYSSEPAGDEIEKKLKMHAH